jgi:hypothetical protein
MVYSGLVRLLLGFASLFPAPQTCTLYSSIGCTTAEYSSLERHIDGPYIDIISLDSASNTVFPLYAASIIYAFQLSLGSTQTPRTQRDYYS